MGSEIGANMFYRLKEKIRPFLRLKNYKNLLGWIPVVWDTHWFDHSYLIEIMLHQYKIMDNNWDNALHLEKEKTHKHIKEMRILLERICEDDYEAPEWQQKTVSGWTGFFEDMNGKKMTSHEFRERGLNADIERFAHLFRKYHRTMWD